MPMDPWRTLAVLIGRLIFAAVFLMAAGFKFAGMSETASFIAAAGFPIPLILAWLAATFEVLLVLGFMTGAFFAETSLLAAAYVIFLAFAFHGPSHWEGNQAEFGFFIDHFTFMAGLLFAAAHGPGRWAFRQTLAGRYQKSSADAPRHCSSKNQDRDEEKSFGVEEAAQALYLGVGYDKRSIGALRLLPPGDADRGWDRKQADEQEAPHLAPEGMVGGVVFPTLQAEDHAQHADGDYRKGEPAIERIDPRQPPKPGAGKAGTHADHLRDEGAEQREHKEMVKDGKGEIEIHPKAFVAALVRMRL